MGSFTSCPKIEAKDFQDETVHIPVEFEDSQIFIKWIRDQLGPNIPELLKRKYRCAPGIAHRAHSDASFRVMQWNILAQALGTQSDNFIQCPIKALDWNFRRFRIVEELLQHQPDIICLQEVDHFVFLERVLSAQGYTGFFMPKPDSPCLYLPENNGPDGCGIFFRNEKFEKISVKTRVLEVWKVESNQVAILLILRERKSRKELVVLTTHLKAHKGALLTSLRNEQGSDLLNFLDKHRQGRPSIVCGDFNADPSEPVYRRMLQKLSSAYSSLNGGEEPSYSTWKIREDGEAKTNLDYIFFTESQIKFEGGMDAPTDAELGPGRAPSFSYPSDHFALICDFSFVEKD